MYYKGFYFYGRFSNFFRERYAQYYPSQPTVFILVEAKKLLCAKRLGANEPVGVSAPQAIKAIILTNKANK